MIKRENEMYALLDSGFDNSRTGFGHYRSVTVFPIPHDTTTRSTLEVLANNVSIGSCIRRCQAKMLCCTAPPSGLMGMNSTSPAEVRKGMRLRQGSVAASVSAVLLTCGVE